TLDAVAEFLDQQLCGILVDGLVDRHHHAHVEQRLHEVSALLSHAVGEFLHGDCLGHDNIAHLLFTRLALACEVSTTLLLAGTLERRERTGTCTLVLVERPIDSELAGTTLVVAVIAAATGGPADFLLLLRAFGLRTLDRGEPARCRRRRGRSG